MAITTKQQAKRSLAGFIGANDGKLPSSPANSALPTIAGTAQVGQILTGTTGTWAAVPSADFGLQWLADEAPIQGSTSLTLTIGEDLLEKAISLRVTATNWSGSVSAVSVATDAVIAAE